MGPNVEINSTRPEKGSKRFIMAAISTLCGGRRLNFPRGVSWWEAQ